MTDLAYTIARTDLSNATKQQLKNFVKAIRESWGKVIDLRKADAIALKQYLEDYLTAQAKEPEVEAVTPEAEVTTTIIEEIEAVTPEPMTEAKADVTTWITLLYAGTPELPAGQVADISLITRLFPAFSGDWEALRKQIGFKVTLAEDELVEGEFYGVERLDRKHLYADILPNLAWLRHIESDEVFVFRQISEFEGIDDISMGDWWVSSPLTCDINNYQYCLLPGKKATLTEIKRGTMPETERELAELEELFCGRTPKPRHAAVGLCVVAALSLTADCVAWAVKQVANSRLVQKGFASAMAAMQRPRHQAIGFAKA